MSRKERNAFLKMSAAEFASTSHALSETDWVSLAFERYEKIATAEPDRFFGYRVAASVYRYHRNGRW